MFVCERSSEDVKNSPVNHNKAITDKLQVHFTSLLQYTTVYYSKIFSKVLAEGYKSTKDRWRALSYEKAINVLKHYPKTVETREVSLLLHTVYHKHTVFLIFICCVPGGQKIAWYWR